mmetsp:Transcript_3827/g.11311  ORF Transcript_3827/g.11311 Transcript_3827/m.11311 type:complete len:206 (+) Transcript_3827:733-1350(+)
MHVEGNLHSGKPRVGALESGLPTGSDGTYGRGDAAWLVLELRVGRAHESGRARGRPRAARKGHTSLESEHGRCAIRLHNPGQKKRRHVRPCTRPTDDGLLRWAPGSHERERLGPGHMGPMGTQRRGVGGPCFPRHDRCRSRDNMAWGPHSLSRPRAGGRAQPPALQAQAQALGQKDHARQDRKGHALYIAQRRMKHKIRYANFTV